MTSSIEDATLLTNKILIRPECSADFADWQAELNAAIAVSRGFVSLEILSPILPKQPEWIIIQRFHTPQDVTRWQESAVRNRLMEDVAQYAPGNSKGMVHEAITSAKNIQGGVTEVFITQVHSKNERAYREWIAKVHQAEAKFPGFKGVYMQSPSQSGSLNWITLLQFDTPENLDHWLDSPERKRVLEEGKGLISSLDSQRMVSPYSGWFASVAKAGALPPLWKQTMIILLVLFPIVMFEMKYLSPLTSGLNFSLATFISNAISVSLISWPMMPIAIFFLRWWLLPKDEKNTRDTILGTLLVLFLYLCEIVLLWHFI